MLQRTLRDLNRFALRPGKVAIFRETSVQHFASSTGDFHDAVGEDPALSKSSASARRRTKERARLPAFESNVSFCRQRRKQHISWRNALLRRIAPTEAPLVKVLAFENLTASRWEYHGAPVPTGASTWASDCTHFCWSPRWYDVCFHYIYELLASDAAGPGAGVRIGRGDAY